MNGKKQDPCGTCGACCRSYIVHLYGYDVWQISKAQRLDPEQFTIPFPQVPPGPDGFVLDRNGPVLALALDKRGVLHPSSPCIFLVEFNENQSRCGVYSHRPVGCQTYPMVLRNNQIVLDPNALCMPGAWAPDENRNPVWYLAGQHKRMQFDIYCDVVAHWNTLVIPKTLQVSLGLREYLDYLLNIYTYLEVLDKELGAERLIEIKKTWGVNSLQTNNCTGLDSPTVEPVWLGYRRAANQIISDFS